MGHLSLAFAGIKGGFEIDMKGWGEFKINSAKSKVEEWIEVREQNMCLLNQPKAIFFYNNLHRKDGQISTSIADWGGLFHLIYSLNLTRLAAPFLLQFSLPMLIHCCLEI